MVSAAHPSSHPQVLAVPLPRRPLMPGIIMPVKVTDEKLIAELEAAMTHIMALLDAQYKRANYRASARRETGESD